MKVRDLVWGGWTPDPELIAVEIRRRVWLFSRAEDGDDFARMYAKDVVNELVTRITPVPASRITDAVIVAQVCRHAWNNRRDRLQREADRKRVSRFARFAGDHP